MKETLLIPAMLDEHFPLMKYAFASKKYRPVILKCKKGVTQLGLKYVQNDMCYPCILNVGQMLCALGCGNFDPCKTKLLMPSAGDACRGANYAGILRKAVYNAGFNNTQVLTLDLKNKDRSTQFPVSPKMVWKALFALFYGDLLMILTRQIRPYETICGITDRKRDKWFSILGNDIKDLKNMTIGSMLRRFEQITDDFLHIRRTNKKKQRIPIIGELYTKYCGMGNRDIVGFLEQNGCESFTNGLSWYVLYYIDSHLLNASAAEAAAYRIVEAGISFIQKKMINTLWKKGFFSLPSLRKLKAGVKDTAALELSVGDGWLISAEAAGYMSHGCKKIVAVQPFGCMSNHVCGHGLYASIMRRYGGQIVSVDVDPGTADVNVYNRVRMLIDAF